MSPCVRTGVERRPLVAGNPDFGLARWVEMCWAIASPTPLPTAGAVRGRPASAAAASAAPGTTGYPGGGTLSCCPARARCMPAQVQEEGQLTAVLSRVMVQDTGAEKPMISLLWQIKKPLSPAPLTVTYRLATTWLPTALDALLSPLIP